jgi:hypothetical protein
MILKTSRRRRDQVLVEEILMRLANLPEAAHVGTVIVDDVPSPDTMRGFKKRQIAWQIGPARYIQSIRNDYPELFGSCTELDMFTLSRLLREAWKSSDPRSREWFVFLLRHLHADITRRTRAFQQDRGKRVTEWLAIRATQDDWLKFEKLDEDESKLAWRLYNSDDSDSARRAREALPPALTKFEETFFHLQRNLHRTLFCQNPGCSTPFFFRKKTGQKYCSTDCEVWARRANKRNWWRQNRGKGGKSDGGL